MQLITLLDNPLDPASWEQIEAEDVREVLVQRYAAWPARARIYAGAVAQGNDVTPRVPADVEKLPGYPELTVIIYPEGPLALVVTLVAVAVAIAATVFLMPKMPDLGNAKASSSNNSLTDRANKPRPNARIPDIFGQVRAVPDMISAPYRVYENHRELDIAYMCIGRGAYEIEDVRDGDTLVSNIAGASVEVFGPHTSPNNPTDVPQLLIGTAISDPLFTIARLNEVNGQVMKAPNDEAVRSDQQIFFADGGIMEAAGGIDFTEYFQVDDVVEVGKAEDDGSIDSGSAIFVQATAVAGGFTFTGFDPTEQFSVGDFVSVTGATYTINVTGGGLPTSEEIPDYPYDPYGPPRDPSLTQ